MSIAPSPPPTIVPRSPRNPWLIPITSIIALLSIAALVGYQYLSGPMSQSEVSIPIPSSPASEFVPKGPIGKFGCSAAACHGGRAESLTASPGPDCWQGSATHWEACDPHSRAYSLLTDKPFRPVQTTAKAMLARLGWSGPATSETRCLACHTNPGMANPTLEEDKAVLTLRSEGVSCEACHGNADGWLRNHTGWSGSPASRTGGVVETKFTELNDIGERAMVCAGCHVGAAADPCKGYPLRDVNHDLLAAGHPRLDFDFAESHRRLPKHWQEKDRSVRNNPPRNLPETQLWLVGRVVQAEAACRLLADRADRAKNVGSPWPEFAESNCGSCHHPSSDGNRTKSSLQSGRSSGTLPWQSIWPISTGELPESAKLRALLAEFESRRVPGANVIAKDAMIAARELSELRKAWSLPNSNRHFRIDSVFNTTVNGALPEDEKVQILLGLAALQREQLQDNPEENAARNSQFREAFEKSRGSTADSRKEFEETLNRLLAERDR